MSVLRPGVRSAAGWKPRSHCSAPTVVVPEVAPQADPGLPTGISLDDLADTKRIEHRTSQPFERGEYAERRNVLDRQV